MRESPLKRKIKIKLEANGWFVTSLLTTTTNGIPDIMALKKKRTVFIEGKIPGRSPEPLQLYRHKQLRAQGFEVIVADDIKDIEHLLL